MIATIVAHNLPTAHREARTKCRSLVTSYLHLYPTDHERRNQATNQHDADLDFGSFDSDRSQ
jgi:hypothetical protein